MGDVDERVSMSDSCGDFLTLFLVGRGKSVGWMPNLPLFSLVRGWDEQDCIVKSHYLEIFQTFAMICKILEVYESKIQLQEVQQ